MGVSSEMLQAALLALQNQENNKNKGSKVKPGEKSKREGLKNIDLDERGYENF